MSPDGTLKSSRLYALACCLPWALCCSAGGPPSRMAVDGSAPTEAGDRDAGGDSLAGDPIDPKRCTVERCPGAVQVTYGQQRCARDGAGNVYCTVDGQAEGAAMDRRVATDVTWLVAGAEHQCALHLDETVSCWGSNTFEALGRSDLESKVYDEPLPVLGLEEVVRLRSRDTFYQTDSTCAQRRDGSVWCWGGQEFPATPTVVPALSGALDLAMSDTRACGIMGSKTVRCSGSGGDVVDHTSDVELTAIDAAWYQVCALGSDERLLCFTDAGAEAQQHVGPVMALASTMNQSCALGTDGTVRCLDAHADGQRHSTSFSAGTDAVDLHANANELCVLHADGRMACQSLQ